ncbi:N-acetylmuramoyl-L-alanine amidase [Streptomyces sp. NPDC014733]|uniref:peptidoglycan recognition protein family protein n=1 Tax=Streptomyces sp. NPDC014733 TaxID=3364885 RepID=UPI0036FD913F
MATPLVADRFLSALKGAGLGVVEHGTWRTHNRNTHGNWGPVNGVMIHHTGPYSSEKDMVELCRTGYQDLPGPLCHGVIDRAGTVHLVGYGRTNHAGMGDTDVLLAVIAEKTTLPRDNKADMDGNRHFYGFECINAGNQPWPTAQLDAMARAAATICHVHGWNENSVIGHKEWQPGKPDPGGIDMDGFRARVARHLKDGGRPGPAPRPHPKPNPDPKPAPKPKPKPNQEHDPMPQALADVAERTLATYVQSLLGLMAASSTTDMVSLSAWQAAAVSAIPAALSALKSTAGTALGRPGTASWLPSKRDPTTPN